MDPDNEYDRLREKKRSMSSREKEEEERTKRLSGLSDFEKDLIIDEIGKEE